MKFELIVRFDYGSVVPWVRSSGNSVLMIAGPNGSGKSKLTKWQREQGVEFGEYINPDDIAATLEGSYEARVAEAQEIADRRRAECIRERRSFSFETVMSHPSKIEILHQARGQGFFVQLFFVGIDDPRTNIDRVALRVVEGGHDVPADRIVARWHRTMEALSSAVLAADRSFIFDNSETGPDLNPRLILQLELTAGGDALPGPL
jgi:predicted ABC-type ATPase